MNYLILNVAGIGDFFELIRWIYLTKKQKPDVNIDLLVSDRVYNYAKKCPYVRNVFYLKTRKNYVSIWNADLFKIIKKIRENYYDVVLNTHGVYSLSGHIKMLLFLKFLRFKKSIGLKTDFLNYYDEYIEDDFKKSYYFYYSLLFNKIGVFDEDVNYNEIIWYGNDIELKIKENLKNFEGKKIILINPFTNVPSKKFDNYKWRELINFLIKNEKHIIFLIGTKEFLLELKEILANLNSSNIIGLNDLSFVEWILYIKHSDIVISVDSATYHIASLLGKKVILLLGSTNFERGKSYNNNFVYAISKKVFCSPCDKYRCPNKGEDYMICVKKIGVEDIIRTFNEI
ncbi:MAG: glycosyltransferase family 9 protein [Elusimicrobiota bacterium]